MVVPPRSSSLKGHSLTSGINTGHPTSQNPLSKSKSPVVISDTNGLAQPLPENYLVAPTRSSSLKAYRDSQPPGTGNKHANSFIKATAPTNPVGNKQPPKSMPGTSKKDLSTMSVDDIFTNPKAVSQALKSANSKTDLERIDSFVKSSVEELRRIHNARDMSEAERNNRELKIMNVLKYAPRQDMKTSLSGGLASDMNFFTESSNQLMSVQKATNAIFGKSLSELKGHEFAKARDVFLSTLKYSLVQERKKILNDPNILKKLLEEGKVLQFKKGDIQTFIRTYEDDIFLGPRKQLDIELNKIYK
ncbi:hypothetical protein ROZALSC1DRAFT_24317 [Rozella allomycis CSF55]|uniref:Uncharacterized protein n=1 Tax=Rozella allomycis (strain CSF55) TaxID=988480 RepID=A0A4P9YD53_ROZAC|nr:hypothetical protein ROZALSC1DRAFT_24317 [Rozella allomycis CSF55]